MTVDDSHLTLEESMTFTYAPLHMPLTRLWRMQQRSSGRQTVRLRPLRQSGASCPDSLKPTASYRCRLGQATADQILMLHLFVHSSTLGIALAISGMTHYRPMSQMSGGFDRVLKLRAVLRIC